mgnify:CR=1 FL=1
MKKKKPEMRTYYFSAVTPEMRMLNRAIRTAMRDEALMVEIKDYLKGEGYDEVCILSVWTLD